MNSKNLLTVVLFLLMLGVNRYFADSQSLWKPTGLLVLALAFGGALLASVKEMLDDILDAPRINKSSMS